MPMYPNRDNANFAELLAAAARTWPEAVAIEDGDRKTSFGALWAQAGRLACSLREAGIQPGDRVSVLLPRGSDSAAAFFGVLAAGGVVSMVNEAYRPRQVHYILEHTGSRVLVAAPEFAEAVGEVPGGVTWLEMPRDGEAHPAYIERGEGDPAQIIYTSGSTGKPKGVFTSHASLWSGAQVVPRYLGIGPDDRIASLLPFSFVYGFSQLACALVTGSTLVIERSVLPLDIIEGLRAARVSVLATVPPLWAQLLEGGLEERPLPELRIATCAGGRLPPEHVVRLRACQPHTRLFLMYGLTEVFRSTYLDPDEVDAHPDSMGRAVPGSEVLVLREDGTECDDGEVGELVHAGPTVALGYWTDPGATAAVFRPHPFREGVRVVHSGDLVRRDADGRLYYVGRRDRMIKTLGYRVSPDEVTDLLLSSGLVREAAVTGAPDARRGAAIVAHLCLKPGADLRDVKRFMGQECPRYMQPARYRVLDALPRNPNGKVDLAGLSATGSA